MYAVVKTGGKQYRVAPGDRLTVERLAGEPGASVELADVLMLGEEGQAPTIGTPLVAGAAVRAEIVEQARGDKIIVFKKKRRQNYRRKRGHRQDLTVLRVTAISAGGKTLAEAAPAKAPAPKKATETPAGEAAAKPKAAKPKAKATAGAAKPKKAAAKPKAKAKSKE
jgi:large subunit ribosomal protein L21